MQKDKARDIARGVLPSTARKGARDNKRNFHHKQRAAQRQAIQGATRHLSFVDEHSGTIRHDPELFEDFDGPILFDGYHASTKAPGQYDDDMSVIVSERRNADKLGPLISWATATEKAKMGGWSDEDKRSYFKAILPDTLQGRHALGHVTSALGIDAVDRWWRYRTRPAPYTVENFRADLARHLSSSKGRTALREALYEIVPVAAHSRPTNLTKTEREQARDEDGNLRYRDAYGHVIPASLVLNYTRYKQPVMVDVLVPQMVSVTCDDCAFLRNDPLATTDAINRFVDIVWSGRPVTNVYGRDPEHHGIKSKIIDYVRGISE